MDWRNLLKSPVLWTLTFGALAAWGVYALWVIPVEVLPRFDYPQISIVAHDPGSTAEEVETLISRPIEGELFGLPNLVSVRSDLSQGTAEIDIRFSEGTVAQADLQAVNSAIDRARANLPGGVDMGAEVMGNAINEVADYALVLPSDVPAAQVQRQLEAHVVPRLRGISGVQRVELFGAGNVALWVKPRPRAMQQYGVSAAAIVGALHSQVIQTPAGFQRLGHQDVFAELRHLPTTPADLESISIPTTGGSSLPLKAVASVSDSATPVNGAVTFDGHPALGLVIVKQPTSSTIPVCKAVSAALQSMQDQLPAGARWEQVYSQGNVVGLTGSDLSRNLLVGGLLAIIVLALILGLHRGVGILALSIPLSLLMGVAGLYIAGHTLNLLTLGALTLAVGCLADDSIIVLESIYHRWEMGERGITAAWNGVRDIAGPDASGTFVTVAVYLPLLFVGGLAKLFFVPFALAMTISLTASLLVSLTLIPVVLTYSRPKDRRRQPVGATFLDWLRRHNERLLNVSIRHPRWMLIASVVLFGAGIAAMVLVNVNFLPLPNEGVLLESFTLPPGSSLTQTQESAARMTSQLLADSDVAHVYVRIGSASGTAYTEASSEGELQIILKPGAGEKSLDSISSRLLTEGHVDATQQNINTPTLERLGESLLGLPQPFVARVSGPDMSQLRTLSDQVAQRLKKLPALSDVYNNDAYPVTVLRIEPINDRLATYGATPASIGEQIQPLLAGQVVATVPQGDSPLLIYVRLPTAPDLGLGGVRKLLVRTEKGTTPLGQLCDVKLVATPNRIRHVEGLRSVEIMATPTGPLGSTVRAAKNAINDLHLPQGYQVSFGGLLEQLESTAVATGLAIIAAIVMVIAILLLQFQKMAIVWLVLLQVPLAFTGGMLAMGLSGVGLNAIGLVGFVTLIGIGLNHDIVLLDRARRNQAAGMDVESAIREAVHVRFRPIVMTTLTAMLGMLPTALGWGRGAAPEQGLALVTLGGVLWSAALSTNLVPALYARFYRDRK